MDHFMTAFHDLPQYKRIHHAVHAQMKTGTWDALTSRDRKDRDQLKRRLLDRYQITERTFKGLMNILKVAMTFTPAADRI